MKRYLLEIAFTIAGAGIGLGVGVYISKKKYKKITDEEIKSVKESFAKMVSTHKENVELSNKDKEKPDILSYKDKVSEYVTEDRKTCYVIPYSEFDENEDYEKIGLVYYRGDGILADDQNELVDDIDILDSEFEGVFTAGLTSVFVRDEKKMCDYEIALDEGNYSDSIVS